MNVIEIKGLNYKYHNKIIFKNLYLKIKQGDFVTILGSSGSGKTTLINLITNKLKCNADIIINANKISVINSDICNYLYKTVLDKLTFVLEKENKRNDEISNEIMKLANFFQIYRLLNKNISYLSKGEIILINFIAALINKPQMIIFDDCLKYLSWNNLSRVIKYVQMINSNNNITIINFTKNSEEIFYSKTTGFIADKKILINNSGNKIINNLDIFKKANITLPFMLELSDKLKAYELIDSLTFDMNEIINQIWK